jgi:hypothetical protein
MGLSSQLQQGQFIYCLAQLQSGAIILKTQLENKWLADITFGLMHYKHDQTSKDACWDIITIMAEQAIINEQGAALAEENLRCDETTSFDHFEDLQVIKCILSIHRPPSIEQQETGQSLRVRKEWSNAIDLCKAHCSYYGH